MPGFEWMASLAALALLAGPRQRFGVQIQGTNRDERRALTQQPSAERQP